MNISYINMCKMNKKERKKERKRVCGDGVCVVVLLNPLRQQETFQLIWSNRPVHPAFFV
jgi:hypothetical protein